MEYRVYTVFLRRSTDFYSRSLPCYILHADAGPRWIPFDWLVTSKYNGISSTRIADCLLENHASIRVAMSGVTNLFEEKLP